MRGTTLNQVGVGVLGGLSYLRSAESDEAGYEFDGDEDEEIVALLRTLGAEGSGNLSDSASASGSFEASTQCESRSESKVSAV